MNTIIMDASSALAVAIVFAGFYVAGAYLVLCNVLRLFDDMMYGTGKAFRNTMMCTIIVVIICAMLYVAIHNPISFNYSVSAKV